MVLKEVTAQCNAANTHCLMARHQINALTTQLSNKSQRKRQKSKKTEAWVLTLPKLQGEFDARDTVDEAKEKADFEKAAQKKADETAHMLHINEEIKSQVFDCPLTSYKWKDDLVALASALSLPMEGTIIKLVKAIEDHLAEHPTQANEPQFKGLFGSSQLGKCSSAMTTSPSSLVVDPAVPALPQSSLIEDALILDSPNYQISDIPLSSSPTTSTTMSYIHAPYMSYTTSFMSHNAPFIPSVPYYSYHQEKGPKIMSGD